jgi:proline racemase/trans-L-3-hydroxyproline dehydratase
MVCIHGLSERMVLTDIDEQPEPSRLFTRGVVIFGDGQMDRSPYGTGTSAAMAILYGKGALPLGVELINESIIGTRFRGHLVRQVQVGERVAVEPIVTGTASITGLQQFVVDPDDPVKDGSTVDQSEAYPAHGDAPKAQDGLPPVSP